MNNILPDPIRREIRSQFPQLEEIAYFNVASNGPWPLDSRRALENIMKEWDHFDDPTPRVFDFWRATQKELAKMIGTTEDRIGFAFNTSHGLAMTASGLDLQTGDEVILCDVEFPANTYPWTNLERNGINIKFVQSTDRCFDIDNFEKEITPKTKVLSISFVQFFNGFKNDIKILGEICREHGIFYVVDGIQGVGNIPIDVNECLIDFLACGAQKWLLSPVGCGFFFLSEKPKMEIAPNFAGWFGVDWHQDWSNLLRHHLKPREGAERHSLSAVPYLQMYAMHSAVKLINSVGVDQIYSHNLALIDRLLEYLEGNKYYRIVSSLEPVHRSSIISFNCPDTQKLHQHLASQKIIASYRESAIRLAVDFYNRPDEIDMLIDALEKFSKKTNNV